MSNGTTDSLQIDSLQQSESVSIAIDNSPPPPYTFLDTLLIRRSLNQKAAIILHKHFADENGVINPRRGAD